MLRHISLASATALAVIAAAPAQAEILEFGPFDLGPGIDCDDILIDPKERNQNVSAVFERGDFSGNWGRGGGAIAPQVFFDSPGGAGIWGAGGTAFGFPVKIDHAVSEPEGIGRVTITVDAAAAIVKVDPGN